MDDEKISESERKFAAFILEQMEKENQLPHVLNAERVAEMSRAYDILKYIVGEQNITIKIDQGSAFKSVGSLVLRGKRLDVQQCQAFIDACSLADGADFYPMLDGTVCLNMTFHRIALPIREQEGNE